MTMGVIQKLKDCHNSGPCAKRREYLKQKRDEAKAWFKSGTNAARRLLPRGAPSHGNNPRRDRPAGDAGTPMAGGTTEEPCNSPEA